MGIDIFHYGEAKMHFVLPWFTDSYNKVMDKLSSNNTLTCQEVKERILNLAPNPCSSPIALFKTLSFNMKLMQSLR
jgi:hypothetical protein